MWDRYPLLPVLYNQKDCPYPNILLFLQFRPSPQCDNPIQPCHLIFHTDPSHIQSILITPLQSTSRLSHPLLLTLATSLYCSFIHLFHKHSYPSHGALYLPEILRLTWKALALSFKSRPTNTRTACKKLLTPYN